MFLSRFQRKRKYLQKHAKTQRICKYTGSYSGRSLRTPKEPAAADGRTLRQRTGPVFIMVSSNSSSCPDSNDDFKYILYGCTFSMVFVLGLISNCVAIYIFTCTLKVRNETTTYMINLAMSDLLFVFTLPFRIFYFVSKHWPFGDSLCKISVMLFYTNMYGSILFLTCISVDRFLAIVYPIKSRTLRTKRNAKIVCTAVWFTVVGGSAPAVFFRSTNPKDISDNNSSRTCFENFPEDTWKTYLSRIVIFIEIVGFFIPLILNITCSSMVLRTLSKPVTLSRSKINKTKILRMIFVHLVIFCFCFVPYNINLILYSLMRTQTFGNCSVTGTVVRTMYPITLCIAVLNCCFDPIVYYFTSDAIQNSIKMKNWSTRRSDSRFSEVQGTENFIQHSLQALKNKIFDNESTI